MAPFKDLKQWLLIYFQQKTGSASFSIFLGGSWKWTFRSQKCSQRNRGSRSLTRARARNLKSKLVGHIDCLSGEIQESSQAALSRMFQAYAGASKVYKQHVAVPKERPRAI